MRNSIPLHGDACQGNSPVRASDAQDKELVLLRQDLREAIEQSGVKKESIAAAMGLPDPAYLSKLFSGEKPITARHLVGLPDDVERIYERLRAERRGLIVVEPVDAETARRHLVSGLFGVLAPQLPQRATGMAKAYLPPRAAKAAIR